jgi:hypothetical protein
METPLRIEYRGELPVELFLKAQRLRLGWRRGLFWLLPLIATIFVWLLDPQGPLTAPLVVLGTGYVFLTALWWGRIWQLRRIYRKTPFLTEPLQAAITETGIEFVTPTTSGTLPWSRFTKVQESADLALLFQGPVLFNIVAQEFFGSPREWQLAKEAIRAHIPKTGR